MLCGIFDPCKSVANSANCDDVDPYPLNVDG